MGGSLNGPCWTRAALTSNELFLDTSNTFTSVHKEMRKYSNNHKETQNDYKKIQHDREESQIEQET